MKKISTTSEIRKAFLNYFKHHNHKLVPSSSLIPADDPTLFFTNAGMVPFKGVFLDQEKRSYTRATSAQRCLRASGKHNDLENVGYTNRHHTFFEMLGNFSFGDYFKKEAIYYAWDFLTVELGIDSKKLWITVHKKDQEAEKLWQDEFKTSGKYPLGLSHCGDVDNFWAMGDTGPCGYSSEIFYDHGEKLKGSPPGDKHEGERFVEIWNLVFMQFERDTKGKLHNLPKPSIDTGMGLERIAAVMQGTPDNYQTDTFRDIQKSFTEILGTKFKIDPKKLKSEEAKIASRVVTDHIRSTVFLIADGVLPSNEKSGYVLRSIIRRAVYYLYRLDVRKPLFYMLVDPLIKIFDDVYPELKLNSISDQIAITIEQEEIRFLDTLDRGLKILEQEITKLKGDAIPGKIAFTLHDTYGLPIILTTEIARKRGLKLDQNRFEIEMEKQREASRAASKFATIDNLKLDTDISSTEFIGYDQNKYNTRVLGLFTKDGDNRQSLNAGEDGIIVLEKTPFYAESGGQIGDTGEIDSEQKVFLVKDTQKYGKLHLHYGSLLKGTLEINDEVVAEIDKHRRQMIKLNHSTTHLLHQALRLVLGQHAEQRGSYVDNHRLRFDFTHPNPLTQEELAEIEQIVNNKIRENLAVTTNIQSVAEAKKEGACAIFGEKYGEKVRVISMGPFSKELCGGTHVENTGNIGIFKITSEAGIAAGMRRIEAVTGEAALNWIDQIEGELKNAAQMLGVGTNQLIDKIKQITKEYRLQNKKLQKLRSELAGDTSKKLTDQAITTNGVSVLVTKLYNTSSKDLRQMADNLKQQLGSAVVVLAAVNKDKIQLIVGVTKDLIDKIKADELLKNIAEKIDGSGGGRPDMAQGGGNNIDSLQATLDLVLPWVKNKL